MIGQMCNMKYKIHYKSLDQAFDFEAFKEKVENFYNSLKWVENLEVQYYNISDAISDRNRTLVVRYHNNTLDNYLDKEVMVEIKPLKQEVKKVNYPTLQPTLLMKDELKFFDLLDFELLSWNNAQDITDWFGMEDEV
jgi:hypothetical protein